MNYYEILGVDRTANDDEIKRAYRKMAAKYHPDRECGDTAKFQEIQQAYEHLSDPQKRTQYDNPQQSFGSGGASFHFGAGPNLNEIFDRMFRQHSVQICRTTVWVTLEQVLNGGEEDLRIQTPNGQNFIRVQIPRGVLDGSQYKLDNVLPNTSLLVEFKTHQHIKFQRNGSNLYLKQKISVLQLITGTTFKVETLSKSLLEVTVPPKTQPNVTLKVGGSGLPCMNSDQFGDLFITLDPYIPLDIPQNIIDAISLS